MSELSLGGMDADIVAIEEAPTEEHIVKIAWLRDGKRTGETLCVRLRPTDARAHALRVGQRIRVGLNVWYTA